jgi:hypothetical protein
MTWFGGVMDSKFSVLPTVVDHYKTLVNRHAPDRPYWPDYAILIGFPGAAGLGVGCRFELREVASYISGIAVFTALLFALVIYVFQLRVQLLSNPTVPCAVETVHHIGRAPAALAGTRREHIQPHGPRPILYPTVPSGACRDDSDRISC